MQAASSTMPNMMARLQRFIPKRKDEEPSKKEQQDPLENEEFQNSFLRSTLKKSITTIVAATRRTEAEKAEDMMSMFIASFALERGMDALELRAKLEAQAQEGEEEDEESEGGSKGGMIKAFAGFIVKRLVFRLAKTALFALIRTIGGFLLRVVGRFLVGTVLRYIVVGIASAIGAVISALGLPVVLGGLAIGGAGYVMYKKFVAKDEPDVAVAGPTASMKEPGPLWKNVLKKFLGIKEDTDDVIRRGIMEGQATSAVRGTVPITEEMKKKGLALLKYRTTPIADAIKIASQKTGEPESTLTAFAAVESAFDPNAGASTSSAKGLFQFTGSTWTYTVGKYGKTYGVDSKASIYDPVANAVMGAAYLKHEVRPAISKVISNPTATDLYFGHFLGPGDGPRFLRAYLDNPNDFAYKFVGVSAVNANSTVFFTKGNRNLPRTLADIYNGYAGKFSPIENYMNGKDTQTSTSIRAATPAGLVDEKVAAYEPPKVKSNENDLFNALNKAENSEAASMTQAPPQKDYVKSPKGKLIQINK